MGLPEGTLPMTQAVTYLALAPKSNAVITAYGKAKEAVRGDRHAAGPDAPAPRVDAADEEDGVRERRTSTRMTSRGTG